MNQLAKERTATTAGVDYITVDSSPTNTSGESTIIRGATGTAQISAAPSIGTATYSSKKVESAVYGHIRAVRALGRTEILPSEIAAALSISIPAVIAALKALQSKGVQFKK